MRSKLSVIIGFRLADKRRRRDSEGLGHRTYRSASTGKHERTINVRGARRSLQAVDRPCKSSGRRSIVTSGSSSSGRSSGSGSSSRRQEQEQAVAEAVAAEVATASSSSSRSPRRSRSRTSPPPPRNPNPEP